MKKPITIIVIIHNDLQGFSRDELYEKYFSWLITELEEISGRPVLIKGFDKVDVPGLSDFNYRNDDHEAAALGWREKTRALYNSIWQQQNFHSGLVKILLLTRYDINETLWGLIGVTQGVTHFKSYAGIASITSEHIAAHEIGHMFGATHEDSEVRFEGWWQDSIMLTDHGSKFRGNSYRFSDKNRKNIRDHLEKLP
ncbi:reprolysin-like metallopeptidase [Pseudomonas vancouverensis]|uniref:Uncharacterized protein n=1 Tax=Pseudomonas vancouverensis TaxID=95300 RepID=A0A1H2PE13_PSEVA|nr:hypothetical protein [Pseudomonas vancouverensis]KAB0497824.1 hypothetical protein F7R09_09940 [Pseudomonas vancouverensis]TDB66551.1 hypothetical protein EIY72_06710 [Pseudomonas vancouverensis]SDV15918.1 Metallo-peptidase family M12B Reprolysin-like [Pseudomonas vancouverensis]